MFHGRSEIRVKYIGNLEEVRRTAEEVTELFGGFALFFGNKVRAYLRRGAGRMLGFGSSI